MKNFAQRLDALRRPGEIKKDFAKRIGMSPVQLSRYYLGLVPSWRVMERISSRTGVSLAWLMEGTQNDPEAKPFRLAAKTGRALTDEDRVALAASYLDELKAVDAAGREALKQLLHDLAQNPAHLEKVTSYLRFINFEEKKKGNAKKRKTPRPTHPAPPTD